MEAPAAALGFGAWSLWCPPAPCALLPFTWDLEMPSHWGGSRCQRGDAVVTQKTTQHLPPAPAGELAAYRRSLQRVVLLPMKEKEQKRKHFIVREMILPIV